MGKLEPGKRSEGILDNPSLREKPVYIGYNGYIEIDVIPRF